MSALLLLLLESWLVAVAVPAVILLVAIGVQRLLHGPADRQGPRPPASGDR